VNKTKLLIKEVCFGNLLLTQLCSCWSNFIAQESCAISCRNLLLCVSSPLRNGSCFSLPFSEVSLVGLALDLVD